VSALNQVIEFVRVVASSVAGTNKATLFNVAGIAGFAVDANGAITGAEEDNEQGEQAHEQDTYSALGIVGRPLEPEGDLFAEALAARTEDGLTPFAFRDLRIHRAINAGGTSAPAKGQLMFGGYGGAFVAHTMTSANTGSKKGNVTTIYVPYEFDGDGAPTKAHAISIDPTDGNSSISLIHGDGVFFSLTEDAGGGDPGIVWSCDGSTFGRMSAGEFVVNAQKITLKGNVYVGAEADAGVALLPGASSPPCPSLFVSPV
jgi:hypothetical protein